jgi:hypothetical protein
MLAAYARQLREETDRHEPFAYVAPLAVATDDPIETIAARIDEWIAAGATAFHVGFAHTSLDQLLERMAVFAESFLSREA